MKVQIDILGKQLPKFKYVKCGYSNTFAIDRNIFSYFLLDYNLNKLIIYYIESGELWSFGGGNLG